MKIKSDQVTGLAVAGIIAILGWSLNKNITSIEMDIQEIKLSQLSLAAEERKTFELVAQLSGRLTGLENGKH